MTQNELYEWKLKGLAKGLDPLIAVNELRRIESVHGKLTPEIILSESRDENAILHVLFEWDESKAAYNWNLQQARTILNNIEVRVISNGMPKTVAVYEVVSVPATYKHIDSFSPDDVEFIKGQTLRSLISLKVKLSTYKNFDKVVFHIQEAIEAI